MKPTTKSILFSLSALPLAALLATGCAKTTEQKVEQKADAAIATTADAMNTVASGVKSKHVEHFDACVRAAVAAGTGSTGYGEGLYPAVNACMQECYPGPSHANGNTSGSGGGGHEISPLNKPQKLKHHYFHENTWLTYSAYKF